MSEEEIKILKAASCPSLSGRSELTGEIGCKGDKSIFIRLTENTGSRSRCATRLRYIPKSCFYIFFVSLLSTFMTPKEEPFT